MTHGRDSWMTRLVRTAVGGVASRRPRSGLVLIGDGQGRYGRTLPQHIREFSSGSSARPADLHGGEQQGDERVLAGEFSDRTPSIHGGVTEEIYRREPTRRRC